jgi:hypothetical protein
MFKSLLPSFSNELTKIAKKDQSLKMVNAHHKANTKDWKLFEKNLKNKDFRQAVLTHPKSDAKLKRYTKALGSYKESKDVAGKVPSRTSSKLYTIKHLANGKLGCGCKSWQYNHSHRGTECVHSQELKSVLEKTSASNLTYLARGVLGARTYNKAKMESEKGKVVQRNVRLLHQAGLP